MEFQKSREYYQFLNFISEYTTGYIADFRNRFTLYLDQHFSDEDKQKLQSASLGVFSDFLEKHSITSFREELQKYMQKSNFNDTSTVLEWMDVIENISDVTREFVDDMNQYIYQFFSEFSDEIILEKSLKGFIDVPSHKQAIEQTIHVQRDLVGMNMNFFFLSGFLKDMPAQVDPRVKAQFESLEYATFYSEEGKPIKVEYQPQVQKMLVSQVAPNIDKQMQYSGEVLGRLGRFMKNLSEGLDAEDLNSLFRKRKIEIGTQFFSTTSSLGKSVGYNEEVKRHAIFRVHKVMLKMYALDSESEYEKTNKIFHILSRHFDSVGIDYKFLSSESDRPEEQNEIERTIYNGCMSFFLQKHFSLVPRNEIENFLQNHAPDNDSYLIVLFEMLDKYYDFHEKIWEVIRYGPSSKGGPVSHYISSIEALEQRIHTVFNFSNNIDHILSGVPKRFSHKTFNKYNWGRSSLYKYHYNIEEGGIVEHLETFEEFRDDAQSIVDFAKGHTKSKSLQEHGFISKSALRESLMRFSYKRASLSSYDLGFLYFYLFQSNQKMLKEAKSSMVDVVKTLFRKDVMADLDLFIKNERFKYNTIEVFLNALFVRMEASPWTQEMGLSRNDFTLDTIYDHKITLKSVNKDLRSLSGLCKFCLTPENKVLILDPLEIEKSPFVEVSTGQNISSLEGYDMRKVLECLLTVSQNSQAETLPQGYLQGTTDILFHQDMVVVKKNGKLEILYPNKEGKTFFPSVKSFDTASLKLEKEDVKKRLGVLQKLMPRILNDLRIQYATGLDVLVENEQSFWDRMSECFGFTFHAHTPPPLDSQPHKVKNLELGIIQRNEREYLIQFFKEFYPLFFKISRIYLSFQKKGQRRVRTYDYEGLFHPENSILYKSFVEDMYRFYGVHQVSQFQVTLEDFKLLALKPDYKDELVTRGLSCLFQLYTSKYSPDTDFLMKWKQVLGDIKKDDKIILFSFFARLSRIFFKGGLRTESMRKQFDDDTLEKIHDFFTEFFSVPSRPMGNIEVAPSGKGSE